MCVCCVIVVVVVVALPWSIERCEEPQVDPHGKRDRERERDAEREIDWELASAKERAPIACSLSRSASLLEVLPSRQRERSARVCICACVFRRA